MRTAADLDLQLQNGGWYATRYRRIIILTWIETFGPLCLFCERQMSALKRDRGANNYATIDHIDCLALGGSKRFSNIQVICKRCNNIKSRAEQWAIEYEKLLNGGPSGMRA